MKNDVQNNKLLTIAIPTYNRRAYLEECLNHICPQLNDKVKVVVRDNKSFNYDFDEFITPYKEKYGVEAYQNVCNIGGDANFARLFETCTTKWLWILGDDDYIKPNIIEEIVTVLEQHPNELFVSFGSPNEGLITGIQEFAGEMKEMNAFANSFFISVGFHNMEKGNNDIFFTYKYLSMKISQIIRVMMHLKNDPTTTCYFTHKQILETHGFDTCWRHDEMIIPYLNMYDIFRKERTLFKNNIFRHVTGKLMHYISFSDLSFCDKLYYWHQIFVKYGYFNTIRYNIKNIIGVFYRKYS